MGCSRVVRDEGLELLSEVYRARVCRKAPKQVSVHGSSLIANRMPAKQHLHCTVLLWPAESPKHSPSRPTLVPSNAFSKAHEHLQSSVHLRRRQSKSSQAGTQSAAAALQSPTDATVTATDRKPSSTQETAVVDAPPAISSNQSVARPHAQPVPSVPGSRAQSSELSAKGLQV